MMATAKGSVSPEVSVLSRDLTAVATELDSIKRLMIVFMLRSGVGQRDVAKALGVNQSVVSRMFAGIGRKVILKASSEADA
jgi:hypothetical protein